MPSEAEGLQVGAGDSHSAVIVLRFVGGAKEVACRIKNQGCPRKGSVFSRSFPCSILRFTTDLVHLRDLIQAREAERAAIPPPQSGYPNVEWSGPSS
jgi:hypothetical protein